MKLGILMAFQNYVMFIKYSKWKLPKSSGLLEIRILIRLAADWFIKAGIFYLSEVRAAGLFTLEKSIWIIKIGNTWSSLKEIDRHLNGLKTI